jgi:hypothetical protein
MLSSGKLVELGRLVEKEQKKIGVGEARRGKIDSIVSRYAHGAQSHDTGVDVQLAMSRILLHRYANRLAHQEPQLFEDMGPEPKSPLKANSAIADGARAQLYHLFGRPLHFGFDDLCDASNENAELFLQLAGALVSRMETRIIRNLDPALAPSDQQLELVTKATEIIDNWSFPFARKVRGLVDRLAEECKQMTLQPNARLGAGANAVGVPEPEMVDLLNGERELALILKFGVAYGAIIASRDYGQGGKSWCLLELSGPVCLRHGLTLKRGGFLERHVDDLDAIIQRA